eukprot:scaffold2858_cov659-Pavlova_lutheri.AAC.140
MRFQLCFLSKGRSAGFHWRTNPLSGPIRSDTKTDRTGWNGEFLLEGVRTKVRNRTASGAGPKRVSSRAHEALSNRGEGLRKAHSTTWRSVAESWCAPEARAARFELHPSERKNSHIEPALSLRLIVWKPDLPARPRQHLTGRSRGGRRPCFGRALVVLRSCVVETDEHAASGGRKARFRRSHRVLNAKERIQDASGWKEDRL